jgi:hypothetical protein
MQAKTNCALNHGRTGLQTPQLQRQVIANVDGFKLKLELFASATRHHFLDGSTWSPIHGNG